MNSFCLLKPVEPVKAYGDPREMQEKPLEKRQAAYAPAAAYVEEKQLPPQPFQYEYGVKDDYSGNAFAKTETQNDLGQVSPK